MQITTTTIRPVPAVQPSFGHSCWSCLESTWHILISFLLHLGILGYLVTVPLYLFAIPWYQTLWWLVGTLIGIVILSLIHFNSVLRRRCRPSFFGIPIVRRRTFAVLSPTTNEVQRGTYDPVSPSQHTTGHHHHMGSPATPSWVRYEEGSPYTVPGQGRRITAVDAILASRMSSPLLPKPQYRSRYSRRMHRAVHRCGGKIWFGIYVALYLVMLVWVIGIIDFATYPSDLRLRDFRKQPIARLGGINQNFVNILVYHPTAAQASAICTPAVSATVEPKSGNQSVEISVMNSTMVKSSEPTSLSGATGHTAVIQVTGLTSNTKYNCIVKFGDPSDGQQVGPLTFMTFPDTTDRTPPRFTFTFGSCTMVNFPWRTSMKGWNSMARYNPSFYLMLGDFIYSEHPTKRTSLDSFRNVYRATHADKFYEPFSRSTPGFFTWDDHELKDNWDHTIEKPFVKLASAWWEYAGGANSDPDVMTIPVYERQTYFNFSYGSAAAYFMMDARRYRSPDFSVDLPGKTMLGEHQLADFKAWLLAVNSTHIWKFVTTSVPFTVAFESWDTWYSYQSERSEIIDFIKSNNINNVIFLSGDRHAATAIEYKQAPGMWEFSVSPVSAFMSPWKLESPNEDETVHFTAAWSKYLSGAIRVDNRVSPPTLYFECYDGQREEVAHTITVQAIV